MSVLGKLYHQIADQRKIDAAKWAAALTKKGLEKAHEEAMGMHGWDDRGMLDYIDAIHAEYRKRYDPRRHA
jgi:hypothetical protein